MPPRLTDHPSFHESLDALPDGPETAAAVIDLMMRAWQMPDAAPVIEGTTLRVISGDGAGTFPGLRLFYSVDESGVVSLWRVDGGT
jgi:hypothetical protein